MNQIEQQKDAGFQLVDVEAAGTSVAANGANSQEVRPSNQQDSRPISNERAATETIQVQNQTEMAFGPGQQVLPAAESRTSQPQRSSRAAPSQSYQKMSSKSGSRTQQSSSSSQHFAPAAASRRVVLGSRYAEALQKFDQARGHDQLVSYFCTIGMEDADIVHTIMTVKEMIHCDYRLNAFLHDELQSNQGILTGERSFFVDPHNPKFHVPIFQPQILSRVPSVDRSKLLFPINLADFVYPDGVQVVSATEVLKKKQSHLEKSRRPTPQNAAWLDSLPIPALDPKYERDTGRQDSGIERHLMLTNQEGKVYYATCYDYFIDLGHLAEQFEEQGLFDQYRQFPEADQILEVDKKQSTINKILDVDIPPARYYLQFTMCIVSQKSYKSQFYKILDRVYFAYVNGEISQEDQTGVLTLEEIVNRIVFKIPNPPRKLSHLTNSVQAKGRQFSYDDRDQLVKVVLSEDAQDAVYFKNESPFDVNNSELGNICVLLCKLPSENVSQLFKRLLFNSCTILQSDDIQTADKCIQGIMQLFYPLNCSITCVPNLPENTLEYISQCSQSVIGVVRHRTKKTGHAKIKQMKEQDEYGTSLTSTEILQRFTQDLQNEKLPRGSQSQRAEHSRSMEFPISKQLMKDDYFVDVPAARRDSFHDTPKSNFIELFDIMQDNSCLIALQKDHPIQKPKQAVCFNSKGRLSHGQGAANRGQNFRGQTGNGRVAYGGRPAGNAETLSDIELPREPVRIIRQAIQRVQRMSNTMQTAIEKDIAYIRQLQEQPDTEETQAAILKSHERLHSTLWPLLLQAREVKLAIFDMVREILQYYIKPQLVKDFKGSNTKSGHMPNYLYWQMSMDIFSLIDREQFKKVREPEGARSTFYVKLVLYPSIQNFLCDKFFPQSEEDNLRQLCALPHFKPKIAQSHKHVEEKEEREKDRKLYEKDGGVFEVIRLLEGRPKSASQESAQGSRSSSKSYMQRKISEEDIMARSVAQSISKRQKSGRQRRFYEERRFFPRHLDELALRKDFQDSHFRVAPRAAGKPEEILKKTFVELGVAEHLAPVYELNYRLANHFERRNPRVDIIVAWLLLFVASLDYQLDPYTIAELSDPSGTFQANQQHYRPPAYYTCQTKLEQLLAKYFEKAITTLIHKGDYDFNPKCPVLSLLFQHTHSHHYLHQKLLQVVHQDIDQLQSGGSASTGMTVASSFVIYQLHWNSKKIRRTRRNHNRLKEQTRIDALQAKLEMLSSGKVRGQQYSKLKQLLKDAQRMKLGFDIKMHDPYVLNDEVEDEWQYNESRQALLEMLALEDHKLDDLNKNNRDIIDIQILKIEQNSNVGQGQGTSSKQKSSFKARLYKLLPGKQNGMHKVLHAEQVKQDRFGKALKKVQRRLEDLSELHKSMIDQSISQLQTNLVLPRDIAGEGAASEEQSSARLCLHKNRDEQIFENSMSFERSQSQIDRARKERKEKKDQMFEELLLRPRSFFSLTQLRKAKKIKEGKLEGKHALTEEEVANARFKLKLNLVDFRCNHCKTTGQRPTFTMDGLMHKLKCKTCEQDDMVRGYIQVLLHGDLGTYEITRVRLQGPKKMRSEVESLLKVDRFYKTLQKIDLSAFSQAGREMELYWNAVFWFNQQDLDYMWLCPYTGHLGEYISTGSSDRSDKRHGHSSSSSSRSRPKAHRPFEVDAANPKRSILQKLFELQKLKMHDSDPQNVDLGASEDTKPEDNESESQGMRSTLADSEAQPQAQIKKKVIHMTKEEKMRAAEALYLKRQRLHLQKKAKNASQQPQ